MPDLVRIAVLISGRGSNMMSLVENARGYEVALVASDNPEAPGLTWAREHGIATVTANVRDIGKAAWETLVADRIDAVGARHVALAGYMRIVSPAFLARFRGRMLNIHPSLLPKYKGLDTHRRALEAGDADHGCSVHVVTEQLDDGEVLGQARVPILAGDTVEALAERVVSEEHRLYPRILAEWLAR